MRCFIAAWPDEATAGKLAQLSAELRRSVDSCRAIAPANLHLTLAFIGALGEREAARVADACRQMNPGPVTWKLDRIVQFARAGVLAAGGADSSPLMALAAGVRQMLDQRGIDYDRKRFRPHLTLLRGVRRYGGAVTIEPAFAWSIDNVALYQSTSAPGGSIYARVA